MRGASRIARALNLALPLVLILAAFAGSVTAGRNGALEQASEDTAPVAIPVPGAPGLEATTESSLDNVEGLHRRDLHVGTYPVSAPPDTHPRDLLLERESRITARPDGSALAIGVVPQKPALPQSPMSPPGDPEPLATANMEGTFLFEDRELTEVGFTGLTWMAPIRGADVEYYDIDTGEILGTASTDETGTFRMQVTDLLTRNVAFRALTTSLFTPGRFNSSVTGLPSQGGLAHVLTSPVYPGHDPATDISFTGQPVNATGIGLGGPFQIFDLAKSAERYVENLTSAPPSVNLTIYWSLGYDEGKYYDTVGHVYLPGTSSWDDSYDDNVILHEIGHYITMSFSQEAGYYGGHGLAGIVDIRLAYVEALGSYFMGAIRNFLNHSQPLIYIETDGVNLQWFGFSLSYDTDTPSSYSNGAFVDTTAANEVAVAHAIYDVIDTASSPDGTVGTDDDALDLPYLVGDHLVWDVMISIRENATSFTKAITMETFFDQWLLVNPTYAAEFTQIVLAHGIEYATDAYEVDDDFLTATAVTTDGALHHHTFFPAGDEDWSVFTATAGNEYVIKTQDLLDGADTVLELYDTDGTTLLATNNDRDPATRSSLITVSAAISQTYYVRVFRYAETPLPFGEYGKYNVTVYILPNPTITMVSPPSGPVVGGTPVTLLGTNFASGATVRFGVYDATAVFVIDPATITAITPANVPGPADVSVSDPANVDGLIPRGTLAAGFTYLGAALPPIVRSITPDFGTSTVPSTVTVAGDYFVAGATLSFDAILCATYTVVDARTILATVQPLPEAVYDVTVVNPNALSDSLVNGFEVAAYAVDPASLPFDWGNPLDRTVVVTEDFEIMDLYVHANVTHPAWGWGVVRLVLESPTGKVVTVYDRINVADATGTVWRTRINSTFGYDEAPSEVLWQFRGERTVGTWTLHISAVLDGGVPSTLHSWALYFFKHRQKEVTRIVLAEAYFRNYVTGFDEVTGEQLYRVLLQAKDPDYSTPYPMTVAVTRDQRHACGGGYSDYNVTRGGWTDSAVTCFELMTGRPVQVFFLSGNLQVDGLEAARDADRLVAATNEFVYLINTSSMQIAGSVPTGFPAGAPIPHQGVTPDGRKAYVTNENGQYVIAVDLDALAVVGQIDIPGYFPLDVDFPADGTVGIISASEAPSAFFRFDPATDLILDTLPVSSLRPVQTVLTPDGSKAFYSHYQWYAGASRKDLVTLAESGVAPHPESTTLGLAMGRDGTLYIADWYIQRIWIYDSSSEVLLKDIFVPDRPYPTGIDVGEVVQRPGLTAFGGEGYVDLTWTTPGGYGTPIQGYTLYRGTSSGEEVRYASLGVVNSYVDLVVVNGQAYYYRVSASNAAGEGAWSNEAATTPNTYVPSITNVTATPDPQMIGGFVNITATIQDVPPIVGAWANVTDPLGGTTNSSMARVGATDEYFFETPYVLLGAHTFVVWASNVDGNWNASAPSTFTIVPDTQVPEIYDVLDIPDPQAVGGNVNISARVVDDVAATAVWVNVSLPGGGSANLSMLRAGVTDTFYNNTTYSLVGAHAYTIGASDAAGNLNTSTGHDFTIVDLAAPMITGVMDSPDPQALGGVVNITATVTDDVGVTSVTVNVTSPGGGSANASMTRIGLTDSYYLDAAYGTIGTYDYQVSAEDASGNSASSTPATFSIIDVLPPMISGIAAAPDPQAVGGFVNITAIVIDDVTVTLAAVNITLPMGGSLNLTLSRSGLTDLYSLDQPYMTLGLHTARIVAVDSSGNWASSAPFSFAMVDVIPPTLSNVASVPDPQDVYGQVNITATVTDDIAVAGVWANVSLPGGGNSNTSLTRVGATDAYFLDRPYVTLGTHQYRIWASDSSGNFAWVDGSFLVVDRQAPWLTDVQVVPAVQEINSVVNVSAVITDNVAVFGTVWVAIVDPASGGTNLTTIRGPSDRWSFESTYSLLGMHSFTIWARDTSGNWNSTASTFIVQDTTAPTVAAGADQNVTTGAAVNFNGSGSTDNSGVALNFTWTVSLESSVVETLYGPDASFTFVTAGLYTVTLTVTDASGNFAADSLVVTVNDPAGPDGGIPPWVWLLLLAAVALAILALFLYRRRRSAPEQTGPEPSPTAGEDAKRKDVVGPAAEESTSAPETTEPANPVPDQGQP